MNTQTKTLTVSIAAYNVEKYLRRALDSLAVIDILDDIEVLIENDGSTDKTAEIALEYQNKYPQTFILVNKPNGGYGSTLNKSIEIATGKYFKQLDGDDWFESSNLTEFVNLLKKVDSDRIVTKFTRFFEETSKTQDVDLLEYLQEGEYNFKDIKFRDVINMHSSTFKTDILRKTGKKMTEHCLYTDLELSYYPVAYEETIYVWHKTLYIYRLGREGQSVSRPSIIKHYKEHELVVNHLLEEYSQLPSEEKNKIEFFQIRLVIEIIGHNKYLCYLPYSSEVRQEIMRYNHSIYESYPELIQLSKKKSFFFRFMHGTNYILYPLVNKII